MKRLLAFCLLAPFVSLHQALALPAVTGTAVTTVGDIGAHYPLFIVEKSYHPENITVVYTKLDPYCRVVPDSAQAFLPTLDFYWLLDATRYKPMAELLKAGIRKRLQFTDTQGYQADPTAFAVHTGDLDRVQHDLPSPTVQVKTARHGEDCVSAAYLTLGPSNGYATIKLETIATTTATLTLLTMMQVTATPEALRISAVTVQGTDVATGQPLRRTYHAAR